MAQSRAPKANEVTNGGGGGTAPGKTAAPEYGNPEHGTRNDALTTLMNCIRVLNARRLTSPPTCSFMMTLGGQCVPHLTTASLMNDPTVSMSATQRNDCTTATRTTP
ncbi:unnamed protein product [Boreogadus saida]